MAMPGAKDIAEFTMLSTKAAGCGLAFDAAHRSDPPLDAAMILFKPVAEISAGPVSSCPAQHGADGPGVEPIAIRRHPVRARRPWSPERIGERFCRTHVAAVAQHRVDQVTELVHRPVEVAPHSPDLQVGFVNIPACQLRVGSGAALGAAHHP
jgi:hypothetical protein